MARLRHQEGNRQQRRRCRWRRASKEEEVLHEEGQSSSMATAAGNVHLWKFLNDVSKQLESLLSENHQQHWQSMFTASDRIATSANREILSLPNSSENDENSWSCGVRQQAHIAEAQFQVVQFEGQTTRSATSGAWAASAASSGALDLRDGERTHMSLLTSEAEEQRTDQMTRESEAGNNGAHRAIQATNRCLQQIPANHIEQQQQQQQQFMLQSSAHNSEPVSIFQTQQVEFQLQPQYQYHHETLRHLVNNYQAIQQVSPYVHYNGEPASNGYNETGSGQQLSSLDCAYCKLLAENSLYSLPAHQQQQQ